MMGHLGGPESPRQIADRQARYALCEFEYPKGSLMRCNDWVLDLGGAPGQAAGTPSRRLAP
jgi:hypothetical protein